MSAPSRRAAALLLLLLLVRPAAADPPADAPQPVDALEPIRALMAEGDYPAASEAAAGLLAELDAATATDELKIADVLDLLVETRWRSGEVGDETRKLGERALEIKQRRLGAADAGVGKTLHHLAVVAFFNGDYSRAKELWDQGIPIREKSLGPDHPDVAESMNGLANLLQTTGDYAEARRLYARAVEIREKAFGPDHPKVAQSLSNLNGLLTVTGDYAEALRVGERALAIRERTLGPEHPQVAQSLINLADTAESMGNVDGARGMLERAISIWEKALGPEHASVAAAWNNLGNVFRRERRYAEALPYFARALAIWEKASGPNHPNVAIVLNNTAQAHAAMGNAGLALPLQERAFSIFEAALGPDHPDVAESTVRLAALCVDTGDTERAAALYARSAAIRRNALGPDHPSVAESLDGLARLEARRGNTAKALELALESERVGRDHLRLTGRALSEAEALRYASVRYSSLDLALSLASRTQDPATIRSTFDALVRSRAVVLDEMASRHRTAETARDPKVAALAAALAAARERLANLTVRGLGSLDPETYRALLDRAREGRDHAERALAAASSQFAAERERSRLGLAEIATRLPPRSALVAFAVHDRLDLSVSPPAATEAGATRLPPARTERSFVALLLRADGKGPFVAPLGAADEVEKLVAEWKKEAAQGMHDFRREKAVAEAAYRDVGGKLRARVWDPLREHLDGVERVFVVPDGALNLVSFAALPVGDSSFLVESGPLVHYLSAERDLVAETGESRKGSGLLAVGGPDYDSALTAQGTTQTGERTRGGACGSFASLRFDPLPAAQQEAKEILDLWNATAANPKESAAYLSGASATEGGVKAGAAGRRVLHLATHGFFLGGDCAGGRDSRGFKVVQEARPPDPVTPGLSPLLLSGLAFAGANERATATEGMDDGVLTAEEVAALDLGGVEWAVLSACDTGVGEIRAGEGVFGLRRAMQVAGVHTLIMSLWPVDDEATREWMKALYRGRLSGGLDSAAAVREAGLHVLRQRRADGASPHPYYWAAFVAAGDWH